METTNQEIFALRLKNARIMNRLTMDELCARIGGIVTKAAISKYENGKMDASDEVKRKLALALQVDASYFERPFDTGVDHCEINFRKKSSLSLSETKALELMVRDKVERYIEIRNILSKSGLLPNYESLRKIRVQNREQARARANEVRKTWGLGNNPISDVQSLLEGNGIMVLSVDANSDFDGMSATVANTGEMFIVINKNTEHVERRRLTALHELGHQTMDLSSLSTKEQETLCHEFASEMLLPEHVIDDKYRNDLLLLRKTLSLLKLRQIQITYGISIDAIVKKAATMGIISTSRYTFYNIYKNQSSSFRIAVENSIYRESPLTYDYYSMKVLEALNMNLISPEKAKSLLYDADEEVQKDLNTMI